MKYLGRKKVMLALATTLTLGIAAFYVTVQQSLRYEANDPQNGMAGAVAAKIEDGAAPADLVHGRVDLTRDSDPFIIIYDEFGKVVAGNGYLNDMVPQVPIGVLAATNGHKVNAVTWAPQKNVRIASVSFQAGKYYILGGRSLAYVEFKINSLMHWLAALWLIGLGALYAIYHLVRKRNSKSEV